ncbi:MAG: hypothetical protein QXN55_01070 [Candidatus Nitrosotenuis sp.]
MNTKTTLLPLEETFNIEPGSTRALQNVLDEDDDQPMVAMSGATTNEVAPYQDDAEDKEITEKIETIYNAAMDAFDAQTQLVEIVEPRYSARNAEVANQYLNTALNAMALRSRNKSDKRKSAAFIPYAQNNQTNIVMASRNDLLKMIKDRKETIIDNE